MRSLAVGAILAGLAAQAAGAQPLEARLPTCFACHGENGQSQLPETPSLGAQPAWISDQAPHRRSGSREPVQQRPSDRPRRPRQ